MLGSLALSEGGSGRREGLCLTTQSAPLVAGAPAGLAPLLRALSRSGGWGTTVSGDPDSHQGRQWRGTPGFRIKDLAENNCFLPNTQN